MVIVYQSIDKFRLAGEIDIMGAGINTRLDEWLAIIQVGAYRGDNHKGLLSHLFQAGRILGVGLDDGHVGRGIQLQYCLFA